jgi:hypothetical protein
VDIPREAIELGYDHRAPEPTRTPQGGGELGPAIQGVGPLPGLDLDELLGDLEALTASEPLEGLLLGLQA